MWRIIPAADRDCRHTQRERGFFAKMPKHARQCNILQWIENVAPDLAEAIDSLCMRSQFMGRKKGGVTYVHPEDGVWEEIVKLSKSDKVDDAEKAVAMLEAHVIPICIKAAGGFKGVGSWLGAHFKGEVKGATFVLEAGGVISAEKSFKPFRFDNIAVWSVKGSVPMKDDGFKPEDLIRKSKSVTGGAQVSVDRVAIATSLENKYAAALKSAPGVEGYAAGQKVWVQAAHGLMNSLIAHREHSEQHASDLLMALLLVDPCAMATVYLLLEPRTNETRLISDDSIALWGGKCYEHPDGPRSFLNFFKDPKSAITKLAPAAESAAVFRDPKAVHSAFDAWVRDPVVSRPGVRSAESYKKLIGDMVRTNKLGDVDPVFPEKIQDSFLKVADIGKRMAWQGYLRHSLRIIEGGIHEGRDVGTIGADFHQLVTVTLASPDDFDRHATGALPDGTTEIANRDHVFSFLSFVITTDAAPPVVEDHRALSEVKGNPHESPLKGETVRTTAVSLSALHTVAGKQDPDVVDHLKAASE